MGTYLPPEQPAVPQDQPIARGSSPKSKRGAIPREPTAIANPPAAVVVREAPPQEVVRGIFQTDTAVREVFTENLRDRSEVAKTFKARADKAFADFTPTKYTEHVPGRATYVQPGESLTSVQQAVLKRGITALQDSESSRAIKLAKSRDLTQMIERTPGNGSGAVGAIALDKLLTYIEQRTPGHTFVTRDVYTACQAEIDAQRRIDQVKNGAAPAIAPPAVTGAVTAGNGATTGADVSNLTATKMVKDNVDLQFARITNPETYLRYEPPDRPEKTDGVHVIPSFELRQGASDVTSYHDFHNLQIAFENVWTELFDANLNSLGRELYEEYARLKAFVGVDDGRIHSVASVDDLRDLMNEIRDFARLTAANVPPALSSGTGIITFGGISVAATLQFPTAGTSTRTGDPDPLGGSSRLTQLLESIDKSLSEKRYAFDVFAPGSVNFGVLITYRQKWEPLNYQVGDLVSTIPLAPKEVRRYTTKRVVKKSRAAKEVDDSLQIRKSESTETSRVDAEIIAKTANKNSFNITAHESIGGGDTMPYTVESTQTANTDASKESQQTKKEFRESVMKASQEYKQEHRLEIDTTESTETEDTTFHEIQNPNDELAVTYMFYELQRTFQISEKLHKLTPVIFVANDVPAPHEITDAWLIQHDWILSHAILDDSFRPAIEYLTKSFVGAELNIRLLEDNALLQKGLVDKIGQQMKAADDIVAKAQGDLTDKIQGSAGAQKGNDFFGVIKSIFDPLGITGKPDVAGADAAQTMVDYAKDALARAEKERSNLEARLETATTALQAAVNNLSAAIREHYDKMLEVDRLRVHVKDNILYYMQAIWSHEPPDQRFFRLYNLDVPVIEPETTGQVVQVYQDEAPARAAISALNQFLGLVGGGLLAQIPMPTVSYPTRKLVELADLDNMLGFKGNYMIFPMKTNNFLTLHMMQDYLDVGDEVRPRDPDELGNYTVEDIQALAKCVFQRSKDTFDKHEGDFKKAIIDRLTNSRPDTEMVIVPTTSTYIEALVGTHTLLEDFKLIHRALDVKKVQAEVRHAELENVRLGSRALKGKDGDPDVEKKIVVEGNGQAVAVTPGD